MSLKNEEAVRVEVTDWHTLGGVKPDVEARLIAQKRIDSACLRGKWDPLDASKFRVEPNGDVHFSADGKTAFVHVTMEVRL